jgi:acetyl-CoA carboxylase carboxyl transferase subunit beta
MNWIREKVKSFVEKAKQTLKRQRPSKEDQKDSLWVNCPGCNQMQLKEDLINSYNICKCSYHFDLEPKVRFEKLFFDEGEYELIECPEWADPDPLNFKIGEKKFIDKYNAYKKKTGQQSAILAAKGKVNGLSIIAFGYNFAHGGAALTQREGEHLTAGIQQALNEKVDAVVSFYQSGGMAVTGNLHSLKNMPVQMMAMNMLKKAGIVTIGICSSKVTGGTLCNVYGNDFIFAETPKNQNLLFAGKRVSASVNKGQELPTDFGEAGSLVDHGMIDGAFESRLEIRNKITNLIRVLLKKSEAESVAEEKSNIKVDLQSAS